MFYSLLVDIQTFSPTDGIHVFASAILCISLFPVRADTLPPWREPKKDPSLASGVDEKERIMDEGRLEIVSKIALIILVFVMMIVSVCHSSFIDSREKKKKKKKKKKGETIRNFRSPPTTCCAAILEQ